MMLPLENFKINIGLSKKGYWPYQECTGWGGTGGGLGERRYSPKKVTGVLVGKNYESNTPKRYQNLVLWACPKFISTP